MRAWRSPVAILTAVAAFAPLSATELSGRFVAVEEPSVTLALTSDGDRIDGTLADAEAQFQINARRTDAGFAGTVSDGADVLPCSAVIQGDRLMFEFGAVGVAERLTFVRDKSATARPVMINGVALSPSTLAELEAAYRLRIDAADYWYDPILGAWGLVGGPTRGFSLPGLPLGGPLRADASGGGTAVFVNGRALHPLDLMALQQITGPIVPGRYFITAEGLAGLEGGPPLWNLAAMGSSASGGGSNTWQSRVTGASGFSDGETGAVFLPNGGIVSYGN
jgi:hypothetical protein